MANTVPTVTYSPDGGLITSETLSNYTLTYGYDRIGRLIRADDPLGQTTWVYSYDDNGNITEKKRFRHTIGMPARELESIQLLYSNNRLTIYGQRSLIYNSDNNLTCDGIRNYEWKGKRLSAVQANLQKLTLQYNSAGKRSKKIAQSNWFPVVTAYSWRNGRISKVTITSTDYDEIEHQTVLNYSYAGNGAPAVIRYNGVQYTCVCDAAGNIISLLDNSKNEVVNYRYDAWGKLLSLTGALAKTLGANNPIRFRGMIYDAETGLYDNHGVPYVPEYGRYLTEPYVFSGNNPHSPLR